MSKIYNNITELIGNTPLVKINKLTKEQHSEAEILAKLEMFNPGGSVKDRIGFQMIQAALESGAIDLTTTLIEPTSGNTGIGLSLVAAALGMNIIIVMPETMTIERRKLIKGYGAELILSDGTKGMKGAIAKAEELHANMKNSFILQQFENPDNPNAHIQRTGIEILEDTNHNIDIFIAGVGTGGTISGVGEVLKNDNANIKIIAVEPANSPVLSGGNPGPHKIQGIGAGFIPSIYRGDLVDEIIQVQDSEAIQTAKDLAMKEGIAVGISSGAAMFAALSVARREENRGKRIVVLLPDTAERYLSTALYEE